MFDNPIIFSLLISSIIALGFYIFNREKDKQNFDPNKNMKYVLVFGIVFIVCLLGKICFNDTLDKVEEVVEKVVSVGGDSSGEADVSNNVEMSDVGGQPPF